MKFECHVHHLFDAIRKEQVFGGFSSETRAEWRRRLRQNLPEMERMPVFVVRDAADEVFDGEMMALARQAWAEGRVSLPYPRLFIQIQVPNMVDDDGSPVSDAIWIMHLVLNPEGGFLEALLFLSDIGDSREWGVAPVSACLYPGSGAIEIALEVPEDPDRLTHPAVSSLLGDILRDAGAGLCAAVAVLLMLDSPAVEIRAVKVPKEINRGRRIMKRSPVPDHTVLRLPRIAYVDSDGTGTHKRPRMHWRRPHRREFRPGQFTNIPLTLVARQADAPVPPAPMVEIVTRSS